MLTVRVLGSGVRPPQNTILVDDSCAEHECLNIDHHAGHSTPARFSIGATSTERALVALRDGLDPAGYEAVCIRHYDADGLLAVWSLLNPGRALQHSDELVSIAEYGDFYERWAAGANFDASAVAIALRLQESPSALSLRFAPYPVRVMAQLKTGFKVLESLLEGSASTANARAPQHCELPSVDVQVENCVGLVVSPQPLRLEQVLRLCPAPICINACRLWGQFWGCTVYLRPRFAWGYAEEIAGAFPLRTLDGLPDFTRSARVAGRWRPAWYDNSLWRLDGKLFHQIQPEDVARLVAGWVQTKVRLA